MPIYFLALNKDVINIDFYVAVNLVLEHFIDEMLICGTYIFSIKRHHIVTIQIFINYECSLVLILGIHLNLIASQVSIHEAQQLMFQNSIYKLINPQNREAILWISFVEVGVVYIDPSFAIDFVDHDDVGDPLWIMCFLDKSHHHQLVQFLINGSLLL